MSRPVTTYDGPHTVYRAYDAERRLLYIGCTAKGVARIETHAKQAVWWPETQFLTIEHAPDRDTALGIEAQAIRNERPKYNRNSLGWPLDEVAAARDAAASLASEATA